MLNIYGPINTLGYGIHTCNLIKALIEDGEEINLTPMGDIHLDPFFDLYVKEAINNNSNFNIKNPSLFLFHDEFSNQSCGSPVFSYSIFETTKLKPRSIKMLNNGPTNVILTTTRGHEQILKEQDDLNRDKPIEVVNEGVDSTLFNTIPVDKYINTNKFTYITLGKREGRKNTDILIQLFIDQMKDKEVALICHTFNPFINRTQDHPFKNLTCWSGVNPLKHGLEYKGFNGKAHLFSNGKLDIYFTAPTLSVSNMPSLLHSANVGIQVSRGEGWDLPLTELLACGIPTITTDCLGHQEYIKGIPEPQANLIIKSDKMESAFDGIWFNNDQGNWGILDQDKFKELLNTTYNNQTLYTNKSNDVAEYMENNYSWTKAARKLVEVINKYRG